MNHATALAFAKALELTEEETRWLIQSWMNKRDLDGKMLAEDSMLHRERRLRLQLLSKEYFLRKNAKGFTFNRFRHCYFLDALEYTKQFSQAERWFHRCYRMLDEYFVQERQPAYRFLYFKALRGD